MSNVVRFPGPSPEKFAERKAKAEHLDRIYNRYVLGIEPIPEKPQRPVQLELDLRPVEGGGESWTA